LETDRDSSGEERWLARRQGFKGKGSGAKEDPSPASGFIIGESFPACQSQSALFMKYFFDGGTQGTPGLLIFRGFNVY
jgi:hypothetical protein